MVINIKKGQDINEAIAKSKDGDKIILEDGIYHQKVIIDKRISICGQSHNTIIRNSDYAKKIHNDGKEYNTFRTYTVLVASDQVKIENLTIENDAGDPIKKGQSVALHLNGSDIKIVDCQIISTQDTLFCGPLPEDLITRYQGFLSDKEILNHPNSIQLFKNCLIKGSVDFIFGCAIAYFYSCQIVSVNDNRDIGYIAAPAHGQNQEKGFYFLNCHFTNQNCLKQSVYLARPWRDYGFACFIDNHYQDHINNSVFDKWNDSNRDKTARFYYDNDKFKPHFGKLLSKKEVDRIRTDIIDRIENI